MTKDDMIVVKIEPELKRFLQGVADDKCVPLSEYVRFVIGRGLDSIRQRNLEVRKLGKKVLLK
jgi:hypothetical protein